MNNSLVQFQQLFLQPQPGPKNPRPEQTPHPYLNPHIPELTSLHTVQHRSHVDKNNTNQVVITENLPLCKHNNLLISATTITGSRPNQEDRFVIAPSLLDGDLSFFSVFDGTTGQFASEWLRTNILRILVQLDDYCVLQSLSSAQKCDKVLIQAILSSILRNLFSIADIELQRYCAHQSDILKRQNNDDHYRFDYSASTSVITLFYHPSSTLMVSHVADSHASIVVPNNADNRHLMYPIREAYSDKVHDITRFCPHIDPHTLTPRQVLQHFPYTQFPFHLWSLLGKPNGPSIDDFVYKFSSEPTLNRALLYYGFRVTKSHKPDEPEELRRIEHAGGSLQYLHDHKPFIRGKDFKLKKKAIQLNYSRAFGSKDLKHSGLSVEPDICIVHTTNNLKTTPTNQKSAVLTGSNTPATTIGIAMSNETAMSHISPYGSVDSINCGSNTENNPKMSNSGKLPLDSIHIDEKSDVCPCPDTEKRSLLQLNANTMNAGPDPYAINSPSMPVTSIGTIGNGTSINEPNLYNIQSEDDDCDMDNEDKNATGNNPPSINKFKQQLQSNVQPTARGTFQPNLALLDQNNTMVADATTTNDTEAYSSATLYQRYGVPGMKSQIQLVYHPFQLQDIPHGPQLRAFHYNHVTPENSQGQHQQPPREQELRALIIGSDGVYDVLEANELAHIAMYQLNNVLANKVNTLPQYCHIPLGQTDKYLQANFDILSPLKRRNTISIYPDFIAYTDWPTDIAWNYSPTDAIVAQALFQHEIKRTGDNVTCIVVFF